MSSYRGHARSSCVRARTSAVVQRRLIAGMTIFCSANERVGKSPRLTMRCASIGRVIKRTRGVTSGALPIVRHTDKT